MPYQILPASSAYTPLSTPFTTDSIIIIRSTFSKFSDSPYLNNLSFGMVNKSQDVVVHVLFQPIKDKVVINQKYASGEWNNAKEVTFNLSDYVSRNDTEFTIMILNHPERYQILFNYVTVGYCHKLIEGDPVSIKYSVDNDQPNPLSNPVVIQSYKDFSSVFS